VVKMYKKIIVLSFIIILLFNISIIASTKIMDVKAKNIINKQLEIKDFQTDIELNIDAFPGQSSKFNFTYYYREPDFVYLETQDFVLLPREAIKTLQPNFFFLEKYNHIHTKKKEGLYLVELQPKEEKEKYRLILWLDYENMLIKHAEIYFKMEDFKEKFSVQIDYTKIDDYSLPVYVKGKLAVPTKFDMNGEIKESQEGNFSLKLSNYKLNKGLPKQIIKGNL